jgi:hypothetical protein
MRRHVRFEEQCGERESSQGDDRPMEDDDRSEISPNDDLDDFDDREPSPETWNEQAWRDFLDDDDYGEPEPENGDFWWEEEGNDS